MKKLHILVLKIRDGYLRFENAWTWGSKPNDKEWEGFLYQIQYWDQNQIGIISLIYPKKLLFILKFFK